ncbi:MAG: uracil-DNA glycosylase family protein [Candidatus Thermoplasmatota archaeon]|nr:uracil-DNA glycosylase family protein [Candidatus Thermoplasmatota archaeon]MEE3316067.1 uracil-DNA glycosylase family protein [Candidatus Thermoplasmatota archaeon]
MVVERLIEAAASLRDDVDPLGRKLVSEGRIDICYNPLMYAWDVHEEYLRRMGGLGAQTVMLGMNPGPHGMGQMGIPFAATSVVRELLGISDIQVNQPEIPDDRRPVIGLDYHKEEVSGTRLWGLLQKQYGDAETIASHVFLVNHCPLMLFSGPRASNITPDKIGGETAKALLQRCDEHLREVVEILGADRVVGVGKFAESRARAALSGNPAEVLGCWHPSPASPLANRNGGADWRENVRAALP